MVAVFIPPAILGEMKAVLDPPMISDVAKNIRRANAVGIKTRDKVACIVKHDFTIAGDQLTIDSRYDFTVGYLEGFTNVVSII